MAVRRKRLHEEVSSQLKAMIQAGDFGEAGRLPSEAELAKQLEVSRATLREALWELESQGLIVRVHGVGSFVQSHAAKISAGIDRLETFVDTVRRAGFTPRVEHLTVEERSLSQTAAAMLSREAGSPAVFIDNLFYADDTPVVYSPTEVPLELFGPPSLFLAEKEKWGSAQEYMGVTRGIKISSGALSLYAVGAPSEVAAKLKVAKGFPLLLMEGPSFSAKGEPIAWNRFYVNTTLFHFSLTRR